MKRLPLLDENAYLSLYIARNSITAVLAYSDYSSGNKYILSDHSLLDSTADPVHEQEFWEEYLQGLEEIFKWELIIPASSRYALGEIIDFTDEGKGVAGIRVNINAAVENKAHIVSAIHTYMPGAIVEIVDTDKFCKTLSLVADRLKYEELIFADLTLERFDIYRVKKSQSKSADERSNKWDYMHGKIHWDNKESLVDVIRDARLKALSAIDINSIDAHNIWANFVYMPVLEPKNKFLVDVIRAFTSVQLLSISNGAPALTKGFGTGGKPVALFVSGDLTRVLSNKSLIISLLDGLELRGSFDLYFDPDNKIQTLGIHYVQGINMKDYIVPKDQIFDKCERIYVLEVPGRKDEKKVVFSGSFIGSATGRQEIYLLGPDITRFNLPDEKRVIFDGEFMKGAYCEGLDEKVSFISDFENVDIKSIIVDARYKPVVYGPDYRANLSKLNQWLSEQS